LKPLKWRKESICSESRKTATEKNFIEKELKMIDYGCANAQEDFRQFFDTGDVTCRDRALERHAAIVEAPGVYKVLCEECMTFFASKLQKWIPPKKH